MPAREVRYCRCTYSTDTGGLVGGLASGDGQRKPSDNPFPQHALPLRRLKGESSSEHPEGSQGAMRCPG